MPSTPPLWLGPEAQRLDGGMIAPPGLDPVRLIVMALRGRERRMAQHGRDDPNMFGVMDGDGGRGAIPKQMRVYRHTECLSGVPFDPIGNRLRRHRRGVSADPQGIRLGRGLPAAARKEERPIDGEGALEPLRHGAGDRHLQGALRLGLVGGKDQPPFCASPDQIMSDGDVGEVAHPDRPMGQERDDEAVAVAACRASRRCFGLGVGHEPVAEGYQAIAGL